MTRQKHYIIYVPGIRDDALYIQSFLIQFWRLQGVQPVMFAMPWSGDGKFEPKLSQLIAKIDKYQQQGHAVSLVGASAGASAVLNAYVQRKDEISNLAYICGKINRPDAVSDRTYARNPAFKTSIYTLQDSLKQLTAANKRKISSYYSPADVTVPHSDTIITGVAEYKLPALSHLWAILYSLSFGSGKLLSILEGTVGQLPTSNRK